MGAGQREVAAPSREGFGVGVPSSTFSVGLKFFRGDFGGADAADDTGPDHLWACQLFYFAAAWAANSTCDRGLWA